MTTRRTAKETAPKKTRARAAVPMLAEGDRVNATIDASRAAGETHLVEVTSDELARLNATPTNTLATIEKPELVPARRR